MLVNLDERIASRIDPKERYSPNQPIKAFENLKNDLEKKRDPLEYIKLYQNWLSRIKDAPSSPLLELFVRSIITFIAKGEEEAELKSETFDKKFLISTLRKKDILFERLDQSNWIIIFEEYPDNVTPFQIILKQVGIRGKKVVPVKIERIKNPLFLEDRFSFERFHEFFYRGTRFYLHPAFSDGNLESLDILFEWGEIKHDKIVSTIRKISDDKSVHWEGSEVMKADANRVLIEADKNTAVMERNIPNRRDHGFVTFKIDDHEIADFLLVGKKVVNINLAKLDLEGSPAEIKKGFSNYPLPSITNQIEEIFSDPKRRLGKLSRFMKAKDEFTKEAKNELKTKESMTKALEGSKSKLERWAVLDEKNRNTIGEKTHILTMLLPFHILWAFLFTATSILGFLSFELPHIQTEIYLRAISTFLFLWFFISVSGKIFSYSKKYYFLSKIVNLPSLIESHFFVIIMPIFLLFTLVNFIRPRLAPPAESQVLILVTIFGLIPLTLKLRKDVETGFLFRGLYLSTLLIPTFHTLVSGWTLSAVYFTTLLIIIFIKDTKLLILFERLSRGVSEDKLRFIASIVSNIEEKGNQTLSTTFSKGLVIDCLREAGFSSKGDRFEFVSEISNKKLVLTIRKENRWIDRNTKLEIWIEKTDEGEQSKEGEIFIDSFIAEDNEESEENPRSKELFLPDSSDPEEWIKLIEKSEENKSKKSKLQSILKNISKDDDDFKSLIKVFLNSREFREKYRKFVDDLSLEERGYSILGEMDGVESNEEIFKQGKGNLGGCYLLSKIFDEERIYVYMGSGYFDVMVEQYSKLAEEDEEFPTLASESTKKEQVTQYYIQKE